MKTQLEELAEKIHEQLNPPITMRVDAVQKNQNDVKRRIAWTTPGGDIEAPSQAGPRLADDDPTKRITACAIRAEAVTLSITGNDRGDAEQLMNQVIAALAEEFGSSVRFVRYDWVTEKDEKSGLTLRSAQVDLKIKLRLPVASEIKPLVTITGTGIETFGTVQEDGSVTPHDP